MLTVYVDKKPYGDTPRTITLPVGKHVVRLVNTEAKHDETVSVNIVENDTVSIDRE